MMEWLLDLASSLKIKKRMMKKMKEENVEVKKKGDEKVQSRRMSAGIVRRI